MDERAIPGDRSRSVVWWAAASAGGVLAAVQLFLLAATWHAPTANAYEARPLALAYFLVGMMFLVTGLLVVRRRPGNVIGWMLAAIGLAFLLSGLSI
jgi:peptidoglycan/LPS O-acetylase OafA/YrhL